MENNLSTLRLEDKDLKIVQEILKKIIPYHEIAIFGSRTKSDRPLRKGSDIDLVVMGNEGLELKTLARLTDAFDESPLPMKTDISLWSEMTPAFQKLIQNDLIFIQKKEVEK